MFTGIIQDIGTIQSVDRRAGGVLLTVSTRLDLRTIKIGESIAVDGVCLTAVRLSGQTFTAEVSPETLERSTLRQAKRGGAVNLELPLTLSDLLGGHLVAGHVDGTAEITDIFPRGNFLWFRFTVPPELSRYLIEKGSVAVDGISLTVAGAQEGEFSVSVIPHTAETTTLGKKKTGDPVNIEIDQIAKYVEKFLMGRKEPGREGSRIDAGFLAEHGFVK
jgi:riboflavin synthase